MSVLPDDAASLRDQALACEAFGDMLQAVRYWKAAIAASEHRPLSDKSIDMVWMRRRLLLALSVMDQHGRRRARLH